MPPEGARPAPARADRRVTERLAAIVGVGDALVAEGDEVAEGLFHAGAVVEEFADLDGREKLELLLDFAAGLPPLPPEYAARKAAEDHRVHECQSPVFLWAEAVDGRGRLVADVAPEARP